MRKILVIANSSDGLIRFRKELLVKLGEKNDITILCPDDGLWDDVVQLGKSIKMDIDRRGVNPITELKMFMFIGNSIRKEKPDQIITYTIKPAIYGGLWSRLLKKRYAVNITGLGTAFNSSKFIRIVACSLYRLALKKAETVFFENTEDAKTMLGYKCLKSEQMSVLNGAGVNTEKFAFCEYPEPDKNGNFRFLFIGRVMKEKGIDEAVEAVMQLKEEGCPVWLDVVGGYEEDYSQKMESLNTSGAGFYHGVQMDVRPFLKGTDCFILPSYHEGMANTILEAASSGRPVIVSDIPGCREGVIDDVTGMLCIAKDTSSLKEKMKEMICLTLEERKLMGKAGRDLMEKKFDKSLVVRNTIERLG